jgi:hypothetical protein
VEATSEVNEEIPHVPTTNDFGFIFAGCTVYLKKCNCASTAVKLLNFKFVSVEVIK